MSKPLPFAGAISDYYKVRAPAGIRAAIAAGGRHDILDPFPYAARMGERAYRTTMAALQVELVKLQADVKASGKRVLVVFEGRDAAGKGGTIRRIRANLNPRVAGVVALPRPTDHEASQWYFQRYVAHLPAAGQMRLFDRSWYNRGVVETVFGFCTQAQRDAFFRQVPAFEGMLAADGIHVVKLWLNVGRAEQLRRFLRRERDPLKQWKLSRIDVEGLARWDAYTEAIADTLSAGHTGDMPWTVVLADDKRRARIAAIRAILSGIDYAGKDPAAACPPDPAICGGPEIWADRQAAD